MKSWEFTNSFSFPFFVWPNSGEPGEMGAHHQHGASERRMHGGREGKGGGEAWMDAMGVISWQKTKKKKTL